MFMYACLSRLSFYNDICCSMYDINIVVEMMMMFVGLCETLEIYNLNMQMCKPSCKHKTESGMISMSDGNQD